MAEFPALPIFTDAYLGDTRHLTAAQHGAYLLLLMTAWRTTECALPDDDKKLARWAAMDYRTWLKNRNVVMGLWQKGDDQKWRQRRLSDERKHAEHVRDRNVQAGKSSALKRKERHRTVVQQELNVPATPSPSPSPSPSKESSNEDSVKRSRASRATRLPEDWVLPEDYIELAAEHGLIREEALSVGQEMHRWSLTKDKGVSLRWKQTFITFISNYKSRRKPNAPHQRSRSNITEQAQQLAAAKYGWDDAEAEPPAVGTDRDVPRTLLDARYDGGAES